MIRRTVDIDRRVASLAAVGVALFAGAIAARGLFSSHIVGGHDARIYIMRVVEFDSNVRYGILLPRWAPHLGGGHGEPTWVFVPPLMQAIAELIHLAGLSFITAQNVAVILLFFVGGIGMFAVGRQLGDAIGGAVAAVAFFFAPYVLVELYVRQAASEFAATALLPWVILGFLRRSPVMIALALAGVGLAHHVVLLMCFPLAVAASLLTVRRTRREMTGCAIGLAISAWSWLPSLAEKQFVRIDELTRGYFAFANHFASIAQVIWSKWGYGYSQPGPSDPLSFTVGPLLIVAAAAAAFASRRDRVLSACLGSIALIGAIMSTAISQPLWRALPLLHPIAFPWRFLVLPSVTLPPLCAIATRRWPLMVAVLVAAHAAWFAQHARPERYLPDGDSDYTPVQIAEKNLLDTSADEYRPRSAPELRPFSPSAFDPPMNGEAIDITPSRRRFVVFVPRPMTVRFEIFAFPGWTIRIDGEDVPSRAATATGLIEFEAPQGRHRIEAAFVSTIDRALADVLSLVALAALAIRSTATRRGSPEYPR